MGSNNIYRRTFLVSGAVAVAGSLAARNTPGATIINLGNALPVTLMKLPYADNALAPVISSNTIGFHYGKHHKGYVDKLNELTKGTPYDAMSLQAIVRQTAGDKTKTVIYNNASQIWNHDFYWNSLKPGGSTPSAGLAAKITEAFGSFDKFKTEFAAAAIAQFGTGWAWLVADNASKLKVVKTGDADAPYVDGLKPLLTIDVWEHAYYLDYQNRRADYVNAVIDKLLNWDFAAENLAR